MQLSDVPFNKISVGLAVVSAIGTLGRVFQLFPEGAFARYAAIVIHWDNGRVSYVWHFQSNYVQVLNWPGSSN